MAGTLEALLLKPTDPGSPPPAPPTVLLTSDSGLLLLPLTDEIVADVMPSAPDDPMVDGFYALTSGVAEWARRHSRHHDVAYLHAEFFGGHGFHAAVAWRNGAVAWGPLFTATSDGEAEDHYTTVPDSRGLAINVLLRSWNVPRGDRFDEFDAVGLTRFRYTEDWAATATTPKTADDTSAEPMNPPLTTPTP
jgi:hypothetical protein